jgi:adenosylmethionine-8-amino-7-oxononanoate aminotransferase
MTTPERREGAVSPGRSPNVTHHPNVWYPFTTIGTMPAPMRVVAGDGATLRLADGRSLIDCISSWWVNIHGHAHPAIAEAIHAQARTLEHVIFAGFTHDPAERVAEALAAMLPGRLSRVFFSDDGSTSVEVALKMAYQHWRNLGESRSAFVAFEGAYHGDTLGAMSVGARSAFTAAFDDLLFDVDRVPFPATWIGDAEVAEREERAIQHLEARLTDADAPVAAVIVEPLVQGAAGMRMCREAFLQRVRELTKRHGTLLIFDEVMTGFGRTGRRFACERAGVEPDIVCLSKGITGGFMPLAVTVAGTHVYESFAGTDPDKTLWHGHSYTANPIGCAAALASFALLDENEPRFRGMERHHLEFLESLDPRKTRRHRVTGTIAAFDLETGRTDDYFDPVGDEIKRRTLEKGLLLRPLGNTLYLMPPYCLTDEQRTKVYDGIRELVEEVVP